MPPRVRIGYIHQGMPPRVCKRCIYQGMPPRVCGRVYTHQGMPPRVCRGVYTHQGMPPRVCNSGVYPGCVASRTVVYLRGCSLPNSGVPQGRAGGGVRVNVDNPSLGEEGGLMLITPAPGPTGGLFFFPFHCWRIVLACRFITLMSERCPSMGPGPLPCITRFTVGRCFVRS